MNNIVDNFEKRQNKLAVLIDADNTQSNIMDGLLAEIAAYGIASVKRIYGDWTTTNLKHWKEKLLDYAIQPIQQFSYTSGKNSTDSALIIDAMDLLYTEKLDGFCIVSSDSDFTKLAARLREAGKIVIGFGERKTPKAFVSACDRFVFTDILRESEENSEKQISREKKSLDFKPDRKLKGLLLNSAEDAADDSGWVYLGALGQFVANRQAEFDPRNYGFRKFIDLIKASGLFDIEERTDRSGTTKQIYVKPKKVK